MSLTRVRRALQWTGVTGAMMWFGYDGWFNEVEWEWNIYRFMFWLTVVITFFVMISKDIQKSIRERGRSVPAALDIATDVVQIVALAAVGKFWMAGFWTFHAMMYNAVFTRKEEEKKCEEQSQ